MELNLFIKLYFLLIMADFVIDENAVVEYSIIDENTIIGKGAKAGEDKESGNGITLVARNLRIDDGATVEGGKIIDKDIIKGEK